METIDIIYEDADLFVVHKPAGVAVQTKNYRQKDLESMLRTYRTDRGEEPYIGMVHRLDQPVEGLMVFAKTKRAAASLSAQFDSQSGVNAVHKNTSGKRDKLGGNSQETSTDTTGKMAKKYYLCVTEALPQTKEGVLTDYLLKDGRTNQTMVVNQGTKGAKKAILSYRVLREIDGKSLIEVELETGRHHQIRVQMAHAGMPLVGDCKYGYKGKDTEGGLALCAYRLLFVHPVTKKEMTFQIDPKGKLFT